MTAELFEPLEEILNGKGYFLRTREDGPTSLDCLALGYLSLALVPELPNSWLRDAMRSKAPQVTAYTERMGKEIFGVVELEHALPTDDTQRSRSSILPWQAPQRARLATIGSTLYNTLADATPIWKDIRLNNRMKEAIDDNGELSGIERRTMSAFAAAQSKDVWLSVGYAVVSVVAFVGYLTLQPSIRKGWTQTIQAVKEEGEGEGEDEFEVATEGEGEIDLETDAMNILREL